MSDFHEVVTSGTGASDTIDLRERDGHGRESGRYLFVAFSGTWGAATLQLSLDGETFVDAAAEWDDDAFIELPGNAVYRLNVATHSAAITLQARRVAQ